MPLVPGQSLSHYTILGPLGAGAMGEVYRAKDARLGREVAIKVLPQHFVGDPERLARFEREAKSLAALNHPNVAQIFGVDQVDRTFFLVLELVPGESLEERLKRGPLPLAEALDLSRQLAEGLAAAHDAGVIHRDLKPANVRVTPDGKVKVLDFGLAKLANDAGSGSASDSVLSTEAGRLLGTPTYMAPEQARGKAIDKRVDVWAFGCVLYECLTAQRAFAGETLGDVLGAVIEREPDYSRLPASTPSRVRELLADCLAKDRQERLHDIADARLEITRAIREPRGMVGAAATRPLPGRRPAVLLMSLAGMFALAAGTLPLWSRRVGLARDASPAEAPVVRFTLAAPDGHALSASSFRNPNLAVSPAGDRIAFVAQDRSRTALCVRDVSDHRARVLQNTEGGSEPCFSPDGRWLAFLANSKLMKVPADGGPAQTVCDAIPDQGLAWLEDGTIVWGGGNAGLWRVNAGGGTPLLAARCGPESRTVDGARRVLGLVSPVAVPGADYVLACAWDGSTTEDYFIAPISLTDGGIRLVVPVATEPRLIASDLLLFTRGSTVMSVAFDPQRGAVLGEPAVALEPVRTDMWTDSAAIAASIGGAFAYVPGGRLGAGRRMIRVDETGKVETMLDAPDVYYNPPVIAPDGRRAIVTTLRQKLELWVLDLERRSMSLLTSRGDNYSSVWAADGQSVLSTYVAPDGVSRLARWRMGEAEPEILASFLDDARLPLQELHDGSALLVRKTNFDAPGRSDLVQFRYADSSWTPVRDRPASERSGRISPDGQWLVFSSDESGRAQVYLGSLSANSENVQVSKDGGFEPRFSPDGTRVYFLDPEYVLMSATLSTSGSDVRVSAPVRLFDCVSAGAATSMLDFAGYEVLADGSFVMIERAAWENEAPVIHVVLHWDVELRARARGR